MFDYTQEGLMARQADLTVAYLNLIDTKLAKINRKLTIITLLAIGTALYKNRRLMRDSYNDVLMELKNMKGE